MGFMAEKGRKTAMPQNMGRILSQKGGEVAAACPEGLPPETADGKSGFFQSRT